MRHRAAAGIVVLLAGLCGGHAQAATRGCPLIVDPAQDAKVVHGPNSVDRASPELDIRTVDVNSDARSLTVLLSVSDLAARSVDTALGARWEVHFHAGARNEMLAVWADRYADGTFRYAAGHGSPYFPRRVTLGAVDGAVDLERERIRITAPLDMFAPVASLRTGVRLEGVQGLSRPFLVPNGPVGSDADYTDARTYRIGTARCPA